jgi:hypothetical protein
MNNFTTNPTKEETAAPSKQSWQLFENYINFDRFDHLSVFKEHDTHYVCNDFEQHSLASSSALEPQSLNHEINAKNADDFIRNYAQSYFEIKVHSGGFYDQI